MEWVNRRERESKKEKRREGKKEGENTGEKDGKDAPVLVEDADGGLPLDGGARGGHGRHGAVLLVEGEAVVGWYGVVWSWWCDAMDQSRPPPPPPPVWPLCLAAHRSMSWRKRGSVQSESRVTLASHWLISISW